MADADHDSKSDKQPSTGSAFGKISEDGILKLALTCGDGDEQSDAEKSTGSSYRFSSPNHSEQGDFGANVADAAAKNAKRKKRLSDPSIDSSALAGGPHQKACLSASASAAAADRLQHFPLSERQQLALLMREGALESPKSPHQVAPGSGGTRAPRGKQGRIYRRNDRGETLLHAAAKRGDVAACKSLIRQGAEVNCVDYAGWTPLHEACNHGSYETAKVLILHGADVNACGLENNTPLHDAVVSGNLKLCKLLLKHGADREKLNAEGERPIDGSESDEVTALLRQKQSEISFDDLSSLSSVEDNNNPSDDDLDSQGHLRGPGSNSSVASPSSGDKPTPDLDLTPTVGGSSSRASSAADDNKTPQANQSSSAKLASSVVSTTPKDKPAASAQPLKSSSAIDKTPSSSRKFLGDSSPVLLQSKFDHHYSATPKHKPHAGVPIVTKPNPAAVTPSISSSSSTGKEKAKVPPKLAPTTPSTTTTTHISSTPKPKTTVASGGGGESSKLSKTLPSSLQTTPTGAVKLKRPLEDQPVKPVGVSKTPATTTGSALSGPSKKSSSSSVDQQKQQLARKPSSEAGLKSKEGAVGSPPAKRALVDLVTKKPSSTGSSEKSGITPAEVRPRAGTEVASSTPVKAASEQYSELIDCGRQRAGSSVTSAVAASISSSLKSSSSSAHGAAKISSVKPTTLAGLTPTSTSVVSKVGSTPTQAASSKKSDPQAKEESHQTKGSSSSSQATASPAKPDVKRVATSATGAPRVSIITATAPAKDNFLAALTTSIVKRPVHSKVSFKARLEGAGQAAVESRKRPLDVSHAAIGGASASGASGKAKPSAAKPAKKHKATDVYEFHSSESDDETLPSTASGKFGGGMHAPEIVAATTSPAIGNLLSAPSSAASTKSTIVASVVATCAASSSSLVVSSAAASLAPAVTSKPAGLEGGVKKVPLELAPLNISAAVAVASSGGTKEGGSASTTPSKSSSKAAKDEIIASSVEATPKATTAIGGSLKEAPISAAVLGGSTSAVAIKVAPGAAKIEQRKAPAQVSSSLPVPGQASCVGRQADSTAASAKPVSASVPVLPHKKAIAAAVVKSADGLSSRIAIPVAATTTLAASFTTTSQESTATATIPTVAASESFLGGFENSARSNSNTPSSGQSEGSLKVPPLRIVLPMPSKSSSSESETTAATVSTTTASTSSSSTAAAVGGLSAKISLKTPGQPYVVIRSCSMAQLSAAAAGGREEEVGGSRQSPASLDGELAENGASGGANGSRGRRPQTEVEATPSPSLVGGGVKSQRVTRSQMRLHGRHPAAEAKSVSEIFSTTVQAAAAEAQKEQSVIPRKRNILRTPAAASATASRNNNNLAAAGNGNNSWMTNTTGAASLARCGSGSMLTAAISNMVVKNSYESFHDLRRALEEKWVLASPEPVYYRKPANFDKFYMTKKSYLLYGRPENSASKPQGPPADLIQQLSAPFAVHETARESLRQQHQVERERLILACEKEVLRVCNRCSRAACNNLEPPFSVMRVLYDSEIYNPLELEKPKLIDVVARDRVNAKQTQTWIQDVHTRFKKRKLAMTRRQQLEADSLAAVQRMEWEGTLKRLKTAGVLPTFAAEILEAHVPLVIVLQDFNLLPASII